MRATVTRTTILLGLLALLLAAGPPGHAHAAPPTDVDGGILFSYLAPDAGAVFLAGDFNGWDATGLPMSRGDDGIWTVVVESAPGTWEYKFIVDGDWREDPDNPEKKQDPFGGANSVVVIGDDGRVMASAVPAAAAVAATPAAVNGDVTVGPPVATDGGILFTFSGSAGSVNLAGSFNGWSATDWALTDEGNDVWAIVKPLEEGAHQYKFVIDGNWQTDSENPSSADDGYGGSNPQVTVDANGQVIAGAAPADTGSKTKSDLNAKMSLGGRYLTRFEYAKNVAVPFGEETAVDPRYRLQRPSQSVDLNFEAEVNELATTYMRLRLDSDQNIIQNNIAGFLDEANIIIEPKNFFLKAYWNQEVYTGKDLLQSGGNLDLPGTIMHDHLDYGKGTAGAVFDANPWGFDLDIFFANVHNHDYYNDPDFFDNTGEDKAGVRLARTFGNFEIGVPLWTERSLVWLDFGTEVGLPSTGIPALDEHRSRSGDSSTWYETESHIYNLGADLRYHAGESIMLGAQFMYVDYLQRFVTGNTAGDDNNNGSVDVPFLERDRRLLLGQVDWDLTDDMTLSFKQIMADMEGANVDQRFLDYEFLGQSTANKNIYFTIEDSPAQADLDSTDVTWDWHKDNTDVTVWVRRARHDLDYAPSELTVPADSTLTKRVEKSVYAAVRLGLGRSSRGLGRGELEFGYSDTDFGAADRLATTTEFIFRYDRDLTRNTGFIADLRYIMYDVEGTDPQGESLADNPGFFNPFAGFRYTPIKQLELVLGYGVDPLDYSIDYAGRQLGRFWYRQNYMWDNPDASLIDAERYLSDAQVFTLRAQLLF